MKILILILIFVLILGAMAYGQETTKGEPGYINVPINASLIPGFSMSEMAAPGKKIINNFSLNLLAGHAARLRGVEFGGLGNYYSEDVKGVQFGGLANIVKGKTAAAQFAGLGNLNFDDYTGAQFAGIANIVPGNIKGAQVAGIGNLNIGDLGGVQIAGITNIHRGNLEGAQIAGILNITEKVETGFQIGLFNFAKENNGIPIGLVSYVKKDGLRFDVWTDEAIFTKVGLRTGTRRFHNMLFIGKQVTDPLSWTIGFGFGPHFNLGKSGYLETDLIYQALGDQTIGGLTNWEDNSYMSKIRILYGWEINKFISIYAGPTFNTFYSKVNDGSEYALLTIREKKSGGKWKRFSIGFVLGVKFL